MYFYHVSNKAGEGEEGEVCDSQLSMQLFF